MNSFRQWLWFLFFVWAISVPIWGAAAWFAQSRNSLDDAAAALLELLALAVGFCLTHALSEMTKGD